jgi:3-phenylpropionate/trans-cinnamate dioxygenase ferredoxin reductase subunit
LTLGAEVSELNTRTRTLQVDGKTLEFAKLALATGASVRRLPVPGAEQTGVCYLRSLEDARYIRAELSGGPRRVVAIGGGFIGLEIAASACELGHSVTVIEAQDRLMARVVAPIVSDYCLKVHRAHGIEVLLNAAVSRIERTDDVSLEVVLADERTVAADIIVVGIGSIPHVELAEAAGLSCNNGIVVDEFAQTSDPNVVAAGDCTMHKNARLDICHRLESVQNAVDQAKIAAATLLGESKPYEQIPWFWSDQFAAKLQMVGTSVGFDRTVLRGAVEDDAFSVFYFQSDSLIGVDSINRPSDHVVSRKLLAAGASVPDGMIEDLKRNLKTLL